MWNVAMETWSVPVSQTIHVWINLTCASGANQQTAEFGDPICMIG